MAGETRRRFRDEAPAFALMSEAEQEEKLRLAESKLAYIRMVTPKRYLPRRQAGLCLRLFADTISLSPPVT